MATGIKTGGRTKGTPNKSTKAIRDKFEVVLSSIDAESITSDINSLEPLDRLKMIVSMSEYITPKYQRVMHSDSLDIDIKRKSISDLFPSEKELNSEPPLFPDLLG